MTKALRPHAVVSLPLGQGVGGCGLDDNRCHWPGPLDLACGRPNNEADREAVPSPSCPRLSPPELPHVRLTTRRPFFLLAARQSVGPPFGHLAVAGPAGAG